MLEILFVTSIQFPAGMFMFVRLMAVELKEKNMCMMRNILCLLVGLYIVSCSSFSDNNQDKTYASMSRTEEKMDSVQSRGIIFGVPIHIDERFAIKDLSKAGLLICDTVREENGEFTGAVVEFAGVKFSMNRGFIFLTNRQDKQAIDSLVSKISLFYGEPDIDDNGAAEWNYYHWNYNDTAIDRPYIRIRPIHSEEGGLTMMWRFD